jgi:hypothetical protein
VGVPWSALLTPLGTLAMAEASYYSLSFLEPRALKKEVRVTFSIRPPQGVRGDVLSLCRPCEASTPRRTTTYVPSPNRRTSWMPSARTPAAANTRCDPPPIVSTSGGVLGWGPKLLGALRVRRKQQTPPSLPSCSRIAACWSSAD